MNWDWIYRAGSFVGRAAGGRLAYYPDRDDLAFTVGAVAILVVAIAVVLYR